MLAPDISAALAIGPAALGWMGSAFHYTYALCQLPGGYIIDRYGPKTPLVFLFGLCGGIGSLIFAFSHNLPLGICGRLLTGAAMSIVTASSFKIFSELFNNLQYMRLVSIYFAIGGAGMFFSTFPLAMFNALLGWRQIFLFFSLATFLLGLCFFYLIKAPANRPNITSTVPGQKNTPFFSMLRQLFSCPAFIPILFWYILASAIFFSFASLWAAPFYGSIYKLNQQNIGFILSLGIVGVIFGTPFGAFLAEKLHSKVTVIRLASLLAITGSTLLCFPIQNLGSSMPVISFICICLSGNLAASVIYSLLRGHINASLIGISTAVMSCSLFLTTAFLQIIIGFILQTVSADNGQLPYSSAFLIYLAFAFASALLTVFLKEN